MEQTVLRSHDPTQQMEPIDPSRSDLLQQIHAYQDELTTSPSSHDVLEIALAVACSLDISKNDDSALLWIMIAGVPSADKTATVLSLRELSCIKLLDTLTENALASGYVDPRQQSQSPDLLPQLKDKCVIIKDLTTLFSMRDDKVKKILGELSSIFDGSFHKHTGTRGAIDYTDIAFSMIACITTAALADHHRYLSTIGPRFLTYAFLPLNQPEREAGLTYFTNRMVTGKPSDNNSGNW